MRLRRGGLGANLAGQVLARRDPGTGTERRPFFILRLGEEGSPVKSFVRLCAPGTEVRTNSPVERPHILAVFHECLLKLRTISGLYADSAVV